MTYTPNVPQFNQTIGQTQAIINANFQYLNTSLQLNHTFNGNAIAGEAAGSHQEVQMPNTPTVEPTSNPTGIRNTIYSFQKNIATTPGTDNVNEVRTYDSATHWMLSHMWTDTIRGSFTTPGGSGLFNIATVPAGYWGIIYMYCASKQVFCQGGFIDDGTNVWGVSCAMDSTSSFSTSFVVKLNNTVSTPTGHVLNGSVSQSVYQGKTFNYVIMLRPAGI